jgi:hypothetical protein
MWVRIDNAVPFKKRQGFCDRVGGWLVFADICEPENRSLEEMLPIYDRIHLMEMGTVYNYIQDPCHEGMWISDDVSNHYGSLHQVLLEQQESLGVSKE